MCVLVVTKPCIGSQFPKYEGVWTVKSIFNIFLHDSIFRKKLYEQMFISMYNKEQK